MKAATQNFNTKHASPASLPANKDSKSSRNQYLLVVVLLATAYLFAIWVSSVPDTAVHPGMGFVLLWLGGGFVTLILLTLAAKR